MNKVILMGRLTKDPDIRYTGEDNLAVARFSMAVDRRISAGENKADFFNCTAFGKAAEFVEKYIQKGTKILLTGRIQNDVYTNREGAKVYSVQILVEELEFAESKKAAENNRAQDSQPEPSDFVDAGDGEDLPFV